MHISLTTTISIRQLSNQGALMQMPSELAAAGKGKKGAKQPRKLSAKCWMAANFPMSLKQLLPILDIVGHTNKHLARVGKFMHKYGDMELFPVKLQVGSACRHRTSPATSHLPCWSKLAVMFL